MSDHVVHLIFDEELLFFLPARRRRSRLSVEYDGSASLGHLIQSAGVPLPEVGGLDAGGVDVGPEYRPTPGESVGVVAVSRPKQLAEGTGFLLDVHLGRLARRMRLLGLDTWYDAGLDDDALVDLALGEDLTLLTKDRGLLRRRVLRDRSAYVRGDHVEQQLHDVLDRFCPELSPFSRCPRCNGVLHPVSKAEVTPVLKPGTARSYDDFARCQGCARVYWDGAHATRLAAVVATARQQLRAG